MAQNQQDYPILVAVEDSNLYEEVALVIAASGREHVCVEKLDSTSAQFRRAPAVIVDMAAAEALHAKTSGARSRGPALIVVVSDGEECSVDGTGNNEGDSLPDLAFSLPTEAIELVMALGRSGQISSGYVGGHEGIAASAPIDAVPAQSLPTGSVESFTGEGKAIMVTSAVGGAGASTVAATIAMALASRCETCLIDADEFSGGTDLLLGIEASHGVKWSDIRSEQGLLDADALMQALPEHRGESPLRVLTGSRHRGSDDWTITVDGLATVIDSLVASGITAVADMPRPMALVEPFLQRADQVILVVPLSIRGVAAAGRIHARMREHGVEPLVVARAQRTRDIDIEDLEYALDASVAAEIPYLKNLAHEIDVSGLASSARRILQPIQSLLDDITQGRI